MSQSSTEAPQSVSLSNTSKPPTILEKIYAQRAKDVDVAKSTPGTTPQDLTKLLAMHLSPPLVPLVARLKSNPSSTSPNPSPSLMAEIKRASPSKGPIAMDANAAQQALTYALSGASVISVLTEPTWFKGSLLDMRLARQAIDVLPHRPAILRKDFILDEYQIAEARLHGADTVLLIVAMLPSERLQALYAYSLSLGMEPLVEVNNAREMSSALALGAKVIGVNNRNLHDFQVDMGTTTRLVEMVRERDVILCALSGISGPKEVREYREQGVRAVLVGEALMRAKDTGAFIKELLDWPEPEREGKEAGQKAPLVKICGIRSVEEAISVADAGADMLGLEFMPNSKRSITLETAAKISSKIRASRSYSSVPPSFPSSPPTSKPWFTTHAQNLASIPSRPLLVGVFQDQPLAYILHATATAQLDLVQLQGTEPAEWVRHIPVPVVRVLHADTQEGLTRPGLHSFALLDLAQAGDTFAGWEVARRVVEAGEFAGGSTTTVKGANGLDSAPASDWPMPIILAGDLSPENVGDAVRAIGPWAVSVSGGVEQDNGRGKDVDGVAAFIKAAKGV